MDDDEEVLLVLAETLSGMLDFAGGPMYADDVLKPLEKLCQSEEPTVREKVSEKKNCYGLITWYKKKALSSFNLLKCGLI